jgi:phage FluMu gp28-like protein
VVSDFVEIKNQKSKIENPMPFFSKLDSDWRLSKHFMPHQLAWIQAEKPIHKKHKQVVALAEKSVRIGWTYADAFKNVRKRLWFKDRDYLFATKDYASALEYVRQCYRFAEVFNLTRAVLSHGEENLSVNRPDDQGRPSAFTEDIKVGVIKFDNGSRIIAFSANPQAMAVYGGDVGLDEFAKHPNARLLWETAQGRTTWNYDIAVWSSHDGEDTLFNEFAQEARAACSNHPLPLSHPLPLDPTPAPNPNLNPTPSSPIENQNSKIKNPQVPWNVYFRVTLTDAIAMGLVDTINRARGTHISPEQFLADCRARARDEEIFQQAYMCNPLGSSASRIVEWSAIERCRDDYKIERVHLEADQIRKRFGEFNPSTEESREYKIHEFLHSSFPLLFNGDSPIENRKSKIENPRLSLGFDVAASGQGDLAAIYIDEVRHNDLWLRGLFTCRTEDWHFLTTVLFHFLHKLPNLSAAGDESGLGRQICWEAARHFGSRFSPVNFASEKHDLGFALMSQLSSAEKHFPRSEGDIASDYFALRKTHTGTRVVFGEGRNLLNPASHCLQLLLRSRLGRPGRRRSRRPLPTGRRSLHRRMECDWWLQAERWLRTQGAAAIRLRQSTCQRMQAAIGQG